MDLALADRVGPALAPLFGVVKWHRGTVQPTGGTFRNRSHVLAVGKVSLSKGVSLDPEVPRIVHRWYVEQYVEQHIENDIEQYIEFCMKDWTDGREIDWRGDHHQGFGGPRR